MGHDPARGLCQAVFEIGSGRGGAGRGAGRVRRFSNSQGSGRVTVTRHNLDLTHEVRPPTRKQPLNNCSEALCTTRPENDFEKKLTDTWHVMCLFFPLRRVFFLSVDTQLSRCPCRFFNPRETQVLSRGRKTTAHRRYTTLLSSMQSRRTSCHGGP